MSSLLPASASTHRSTIRINFSAASTENESRSLRSTRTTHSLTLLHLSSAPSASTTLITLLAVFMIKIISNPPLSRSYRYRCGSSPQSSSKRTTLKANTLDLCEIHPPAMTSGAMYPLVPSILVARVSDLHGGEALAISPTSV